jgi:hypothetical protein
MLRILTLLTIAGLLAGVSPDPTAALAIKAVPDTADAPTGFCADGPPYYAFELFTTKNIPGTGLATGTVEASVSGASPFSVALGDDGSYEYDLALRLDRMRPPREGRLVAWVTTPDIDLIERMGALDDNLVATGSVSWNQYIVVVTLEAEDDPASDRWAGPIVFRGMSRSGMLHTMVGHGALQQENCAAFGYGN